MPELLKRCVVAGRSVAELLDWPAPLLMRIYFGYFWAVTGWSKVGHLNAFAQRFVAWGIPFPHLSAALSGYTELIGGILIGLGLFTRLAAIPLLFNLFVAVVKVKLPEVSGPLFDELYGFASMDEVLYMFIFFWLMMAGPGRASLDHLIGRMLSIG